MLPVSGEFVAAAGEAVLDLLGNVFPGLWPNVVTGDEFEALVPPWVSC